MRCGSEGYGLREETNGKRKENYVYHTERKESEKTSLKHETDYKFTFLISWTIKCIYITKPLTSRRSQK